MKALTRRISATKRDSRGFSLVELIIVIAIMAVLVAVLAPQFIKYVENSRIQKDESAAAEVLRAVQIAIADETIYNDIPTTGTTVVVAGGGPPTSDVAALQTELATSIGTVPAFSSKKHQAPGDDVYTINVTVGVGGTVTGAWG
ncbi:MAG: type II secretion system GspH family protein [Oscillospiraceae bacterium]|jgi:prepilin-type N-terminal cleavage/methylation domain-containing protein|nr:type II secretion system GspH family protein [Oscillospiraceae bacterium]